jgi:hypothetical protein
VNALNAGVSRQQIVNIFLSSTEATQNLVTADFNTLLGRAPTAAELAADVNALQCGEQAVLNQTAAGSHARTGSHVRTTGSNALTATGSHAFTTGSNSLVATGSLNNLSILTTSGSHAGTTGSHNRTSGSHVRTTGSHGVATDNLCNGSTVSPLACVTPEQLAAVLLSSNEFFSRLDPPAAHAAVKAHAHAHKAAHKAAHAVAHAVAHPLLRT